MPWKYFKKDEFKCPCCGQNKINDFLVEKLDIARDIAGVPFIISSGYRCPKHNAEVGGKKNSAHLKGLAADIYVEDDETRWKILDALLKVGFNRIGIAKDFIHCDIDETKPNPRIWLY